MKECNVSFLKTFFIRSFVYSFCVAIEIHFLQKSNRICSRIRLKCFVEIELRFHWFFSFVYSRALIWSTHKMCLRVLWQSSPTTALKRYISVYNGNLVDHVLCPKKGDKIVFCANRFIGFSIDMFLSPVCVCGVDAFPPGNIQLVIAVTA